MNLNIPLFTVFRWLDCRGHKSHDVLSVGKLEPDELPHQDQATWLLQECSRSEAEQLLAGKIDGTFLVRPSRTGQYALSIV